MRVILGSVIRLVVTVGSSGELPPMRLRRGRTGFAGPAPATPPAAPRSGAGRPRRRSSGRRARA